jgi:hypothetical protein
MWSEPMAIYRNPVPGSVMKSPIKCVDFVDGAAVPNGMRTGCAAKFAAFGVGKKGFACPNGCQAGAFCFPRKHRTSSFSHYHQGIDLGSVAGSDIVSVTDGVVVHAGVRRQALLLLFALSVAREQDQKALTVLAFRWAVSRSNEPRLARPLARGCNDLPSRSIAITAERAAPRAR